MGRIIHNIYVLTILVYIIDRHCDINMLINMHLTCNYMLIIVVIVFTPICTIYHTSCRAFEVSTG